MPPAAFFSLPTRAWQLALGGLVALTATQWRRLPPRAAAVTGWTGLALTLLACVWFTATTPYPGVAALLPTLGAVLVIGAGCATPAHGCGRLLGLAPMRAIGRISYSWYLWHWPVLVLAPALLGHPLGLPARLAAALLSAGLAVLTLRYLENPLRFAPKIRNSPWRSLGLGAIATAVAVAVGMALTLVVPTPIGHADQPKRPPSPPHHYPPTPTWPPTTPPSNRYLRKHRPPSPPPPTSNAVPANLNPPLTDVPAQLTALSANGCMRLPYQGGQPECAVRRYHLAHDGSHRRRLPCRDVVPGVPRSRRPAALATRNHGQVGLPAHGLASRRPTH